jgi:hypothetical protein
MIQLSLTANQLDRMFRRSLKLFERAMEFAFSRVCGRKPRELMTPIK